MTQLHALGLLAPVLLGNEIAFTEFDVRVATLAQALLERGLDIRLLGSLRRVAEREIGLHRRPLGAAAFEGQRARWRSGPYDVTVEVAGRGRGPTSVLYERALQDYLGR